MSNIILSPMQSEAVGNITKWYKVPVKKSQVFYLAGYAGSGKTSLVGSAIESMGISDSDVCYATYTGKAAMVLSSKSDKPVSTIHSLCYELVEDYMDEATNKVHMVWKIRTKSPAAKAKLIVLDEVSMVNKSMMADLMSFGCKILVLGDPFQLPPVDGDAYFDEHYKPDYFLTEVHRQALENPIIWLSQQVRNGETIKYGDYGETVTKIRYDDATDDMWTGADQIIVGTNKTRRTLNNWFRELLGYDKVNSRFPVIGDRLICLKNRWDDGLVNGMMLNATTNARVAQDRESFKLDFASDGSLKFTDMNCSSADVLGTKLRMPYWEQKKLVNIDYGYAITCHKAQGSQYNDVLFVDQGFGRWLDDNTYYRHLYTAMTRAAEHLIILE
jgi:exodeoxyribonuclease-5